MNKKKIMENALIAKAIEIKENLKTDNNIQAYEKNLNKMLKFADKNGLLTLKLLEMLMEKDIYISNEEIIRRIEQKFRITNKLKKLCYTGEIKYEKDKENVIELERMINSVVLLDETESKESVNDVIEILKKLIVNRSISEQCAIWIKQELDILINTHEEEKKEEEQCR